MKKIFILTVLILGGAFMFSSCATKPPVQDAKTVFIPNGDHEIPAIITLPEGSGPFPAVVMLHGFGSDKDEAGGGYKLFAPILANEGIASIRFDFIGLGESTTDHIQFDLNTGVSDAEAAAAYLVKNYNVDLKRLGLLGWSKGGTIAMLTAGRSDTFKSLVTWAGAPVLSSAVYSDEGYEVAKKEGKYVQTFDWRGDLNLSLSAFEVAKNTNVLTELTKFTGPILAITGSIDETVPPENAYNIVVTSVHPNSRVLTIEGTGHTFGVFGEPTPEAYKILTAETVKWFKDTL
jgi:dienelactone hydrolase